MADAGTEQASESALTVVVAGAANLGIALAKGVAAVLSGSAAMASEAAHSVADTVTELLLWVSLRRGTRPPDARHPFGYGRETYLWALLAAAGTFVAGAVVSILEGLRKILHGTHEEASWLAYAVLGIAFVLEGVSWVRAVVQVRRGARRWRVTPTDFLRRTSDTAVKAVALEDTAALAGLAVAGAGLWLSDATGSPLWDGLASVVIGALLVAVAAALATSNLSLLVGRSAPAELETRLRQEVAGIPGVVSVPLFVTTVLGPGQLLVAAKAEFADGCTADEIEALADEAERRMVAHYAGVRHVFVDPTPGAPREEEGPGGDAEIGTVGGL